MTAFESLRDAFDINWTTILVGWNGLGTLSPWPERKDEFPPLLSRAEIASYADQSLAAAMESSQQELVIKLSLPDQNDERREDVARILQQLSKQERHDPELELRKWRFVLLERVLRDLPADPLCALIALSEFWLNFGGPRDSPHEVQGRGNTITPADYYTPQNLREILARHRQWIEKEKAILRQANRS